MKQLIKGGHVVDPATNVDGIYDVLIEDGKIAKVASDINDSEAEVIDAAGKIVAPGLIDMHVHFREPGQEAKEDFESGSKAAAAGGFTTVATMPNTKPVVDTAALVRSLQERAKDVGIVHVEIIGALTKNQEGKELAEVGDMNEAGAVAFSDDGHFVQSAKMMLNGFDYVKPFNKVIINHEEETTLTEDGSMNEGHCSTMLGLKGRPTVSEDIAVGRDILLAEYSGARLHVAHISSAYSVELVRAAKKRGVHVTAEVTPQHLLMTDDMVDITDSSTKINPPLRTAKDTEVLFEGLKDGTIDMIVTDHSPHAVEEKDREYMYAPSGFPGLETSLGLILTGFYHTGKLTMTEIVEKMSTTPAKIFGLKAGSLEVGATADITVIDPEMEWVVDGKKFYTKGSHSPFIGKKLKGKAVMTIVDGKVVMKDGLVVEN